MGNLSFLVFFLVPPQLQVDFINSMLSDFPNYQNSSYYLLGK